MTLVYMGKLIQIYLVKVTDGTERVIMEETPVH